MLTKKRSLVHKQWIDARYKQLYLQLYSQAFILKDFKSVTQHTNWIYGIILYNMPPLSNTPAVQKNKRYCLVYAVVELAADVCLALSKTFSDSIYLPHRKQLRDFTLNFPLMHFFSHCQMEWKIEKKQKCFEEKT